MVGVWVYVGVTVRVLVGVGVKLGVLVGVGEETPHIKGLKLMAMACGLQPRAEVRVKVTRSVERANVVEVKVKPPRPLAVIVPPPAFALTETVSPGW